MTIEELEKEYRIYQNTAQTLYVQSLMLRISQKIYDLNKKEWARITGYPIPKYKKRGQNDNTKN